MKRVIGIATLLGVVTCGDAADRRMGDGACPFPARLVEFTLGKAKTGEECVLVGARLHVIHGPKRQWHVAAGATAAPATVESRYVFGVLDGEYAMRRDNGSIVETGRYQLGKRIGAWYEEDALGRRAADREFDEAGRVHGRAVTWSDGSPVEVRCYSHGQRVWSVEAPDAVEEARRRPCP